MSEADDFAALLTRLRAGDEAAARELVARYEPVVRREVRVGLKDRRLARQFDSADVAQSVFATFFQRTAAGEYDLAGPDDLVRLLVTLTRNKLASRARTAYAGKRDVRRDAPPDSHVFDRVAKPEPTPSQHAAAADLYRHLLDRLGPEERVLVALRHEGLSWEEIAARVGGTAQARRVQLSRALSRIGRGLGLDGPGEPPPA